MKDSLNNTSDTSAAFNTDLKAHNRAGLVLFFLLFGLGGFWATTAPINGAALAPGQVMVRSYSKTVQHLEGGIINEIFVENGARVREGEPILDIDDTQSVAQLEIANSQYLSFKALETRLIAERDGLSELVFPSELSINGPRAIKEINSQTEIFEARRTALQTATAVLEQRIEQLQSQIEGLKGLQLSKEILAASYKEELKDVRELLDQGFSDKNRLRDLERNVAQLNGEAADLIANIAGTEVGIGESRLQIIQQENDFQNQVVTELSQVQTDINDISERIFALEDIVSRTIVRAPESGIVNGMQVHTVGGVITPGMRIVDIVPEKDDLVVEAKVSPVDIDRVSVGQEANIRFSSFGGGTVPAVFGTVITISADTLFDEATGGIHYLARIEVSDESLNELDDLTLVPGMPAEVFIATGERTLIEYLFKPFSNAMARGLRED